MSRLSSILRLADAVDTTEDISWDDPRQRALLNWELHQLRWFSLLLADEMVGTANAVLAQTTATGWSAEKGLAYIAALAEHRARDIAERMIRLPSMTEAEIRADVRRTAGKLPPDILTRWATDLNVDNTKRMVRVICGKSTEPPQERALCEQDKIILRPDQPYIFRVMPGCSDCAAIAAAYMEELDEVRIQCPSGTDRDRRGR